jgi:hypothetical protein
LKTEAPSTRVEGKYLPVRHCSRNNVHKKNIVQELVYSDRAAVELQDCKLTYSEAHQLVDETPPVDAALMPHGVENNLQQVCRSGMILHTLQAYEYRNSTPILNHIAMDTNPRSIVDRCNFIARK